MASVCFALAYPGKCAYPFEAWEGKDVDVVVFIVSIPTTIHVTVIIDMSTYVGGRLVGDGDYMFQLVLSGAGTLTMQKPSLAGGI